MAVRDVKTRKILEITQVIANHFKESPSPAHLIQAILVEGRNLAVDILLECGATQEKMSGHKLVSRCSKVKLKRVRKFSKDMKNLIKEVEKYSDVVFTNPNSLLKYASTDKDTARLLEELGVSTDKLFLTLSTTRLKKKSDYAPSPILDKFSTDTTEEARKGELDPVIGREQETTQVITTLCRRIKRNALLTGEAGVGKTAICEGLAQRIADGKVPEQLKNCRIISLNVSALVSGTKFRGDFEERINAIIQEILGSENIILFIDEIHRIIGAGDSAKGSDAANTLKPYLSKGRIQVIGATTPKEEREVFEKDHALGRRFQRIKVEEPSEEETVQILRGLKGKYQEHHGVSIPDDIIKHIVRSSMRFVHGGMLPDKAVDILDQTCANKKLTPTTKSKTFNIIEGKVRQLEKRIEAIMENSGNVIKAAEFTDELNTLKEDMEISKSRDALENRGIPVGVEDVSGVISKLTGIPAAELNKTDLERLRSLGPELKKMVIGQDPAVSTVVKAVHRSRVGARKQGQPIGSFLFMGPTGVGKSYLSKKLAHILFGNEKHVRRFDMSEYRQEHTVSRLLGSPPGYIGYEEGGELINAIKDNPYCVILFDEVEKAHSSIYDIFLQILDDGRITDKLNRSVSLENCIIIMTSNIGSNAIVSGSIGFTVNTEEARNKDIEQSVLSEMKQFFRPEFLNRVGNTIVFNMLSKDDLSQIFELQIDELNEIMANEHGRSVVVTKAAKERILNLTMKEDNANARPMRRLIRDCVEDLIAEKVVGGEAIGMNTVVDYKKDEFIIKKESVKERVDA